MNDSGNDDPRRANPFPENELPKWLLRKAAAGLRQFVLAARGYDYKLLARFSHDLGTCARTAADLTRGLEICVKSVRKTRLGDCWTDAADKVRGGSTLAEALESAGDLLPPFYLPAIRAGEASGRLSEAFEFLESHCRMLAGPAMALRNLWFYPLVIMVGGSLVRIILLLATGNVTEAISDSARELVGWLQLVVIIVIAVASPAKYFVDQARVSLPLLGPLEREIALHRFFRVMSLLYSVGQYRVESMIRTAAGTVSNNAARLELLKAAGAIEEGVTIPEAFARVSLLTSSEKGAIEVGEMSGSLETTFGQISDDTGASMLSKLNFIQPILVRIVTALVVFSIATTMLRLVLLSG